MRRAGGEHGRGALAAGTKGKRYALPNANIIIHQVLGGAEGQASDVEIRVKYMLKLKQRLNGILSKHTGKPVEQVERTTDRDNFMSAEEAKAYGIVDQVVVSRKKFPAEWIKLRWRCDRMARPTNITMCSFCGKTHAEVRKLIAGPGVYICDNCIILCKNVLDRELQIQNQKKQPKLAVPRPAEIKRQLDRFCIGQEHAKKTLAVAVHNHFKRIEPEPWRKMARRQKLLQPTCRR